MRILYVITKANWGGAQKYVYDLATAAKAAGHEVAVAVGGTGPLTEKLSAAHVRVVPLSLKQRSSFLFDLITFGSLFSLIALFRAERPDVVHVNSAKAGGLGAFAARTTGVPHVVFTAHGWAWNESRPWFSRLSIRFFSWLTVLLSHTTICVSGAMQRSARWMPFVRRKLVIIHNGIDCPDFLSREAARAELAPPSVGKYWLGMISELHPTKRVEDAIRAVKLLVEKHADLSLVVIGEGPLRADLEDLIRDLGLGRHVYLAGFHDAAGRLLKAFDLFVHASMSESFGYVIAEAGCAALPVVATNVGGIPEIIPDNAHGLLVPSKDPEALAAGIEAFMKDPMHALEAAARLHARVATHFSKAEMVRKTLERY